MAILDNSNPMVSSDMLLTIEGLSSGGTPVYWTDFSGISFKRKDAETTNGLSGRVQYTEGGISSYENITIAKPEDPDTDSVIYDWIAQYENGKVFSFRIRPIKRTSTGSNVIEYRGTKAWDITGRLIGYKTLSGVDLMDTKVMKLELEFRIENAELK